MISPVVIILMGSKADEPHCQKITEAVRGEGAHLVDRNGYRFMGDYHPEQRELAPRDRTVAHSARCRPTAPPVHPSQNPKRRRRSKRLN